ncbi:MAG: hypothetical protein WC484_08375, partial [Candidatus Omnitrophota bacterium]
MPKKIGYYMWRISTLILYIIVSGLTLFFAYGYRYDFQKSNVQKTSIIDIVGEEQPAVITLDGVSQAQVIPAQIKNVLPGIHLLSVAEDGFLPWQREIEVAADLVSIVDDIYLVPNGVSENAKKIKEFSSEQNVYAG